MRMNYNKYYKLSLEEKREFVNMRLDDEYIISKEFEENNGDLKIEIEVIHKKCGCDDFVTLKELFKRTNKCPECYREKREETFKEIIKGKYELLSKYYNTLAYVKVRILKCNHIEKIRPHTIISAIKHNKDVECKSCKVEKKKNTMQKHLNHCSNYDGEYKVIDIKDDDIVETIHKKCNNTLYLKYKSIINHKVSCKYCNEEDKQTNFEKKLRNKYKLSKDFKLKGKYINSSTPIYLEHKCGYIKKICVPSLELLEEIKCNVCHFDQFTNTKELNTILYKYTKGEYIAAKDIDEEKKEVFLRRKECGHVFYTDAKSFFKNPHCPKCKEEKELIKRYNHFRKSLYKKYGSEYDIASKYRTYTTSIELIHNKCGTVFSDIPARVLKRKTKEPCPVCNKLKIKSTENRKKGHLETLYNKFGNEYLLVGEYVHSREETTYYHKKCGSRFRATPLQMTKRMYPCTKCNNGVLIKENE